MQKYNYFEEYCSFYSLILLLIFVRKNLYTSKFFNHINDKIIFYELYDKVFEEYKGYIV